MLFSNIQNTKIKNIINPGLQTVLQTIYERKIICTKDPEKREELYKLYKAYRNHITNLSRRSKESYFKNIFEKNKKNT